MRVRLTVTPPYRITPDHRSVDREAGANPARTRHCDRGCSPQAIALTIAATGPAEGPGRCGRGGPGSQETSCRPESPDALVERGGSVKHHRRLAGLAAGVCCLVAA